MSSTDTPATALARSRARLLLVPSLLLLALPAQASQPGGSVRSHEVLRTMRTWTGAPITYPEGQPEIVAMTIDIAPGGETGWHAHPVPSFAFVLAGTLEIRLASGAVKRVGAGEAIAEVVDLAHNGRNVGPEPVRLLVLYAGSRDEPVTVPVGD